MYGVAKGPITEPHDTLRRTDPGLVHDGGSVEGGWCTRGVVVRGTSRAVPGTTRAVPGTTRAVPGTPRAGYS